MHELLDKSRDKGEVLPPNPTNRHSQKMVEKHLRSAGFNDNIEELAARHLEMVKEAEEKNKIMRREMKESPVLSQIKRGKLGFDSILILFAIFGSFALPYFFYEKFKTSRETIVKSRKYSPEVIENISDDSPIDIDEVSEQSIHYDNPKRRATFDKNMEMARKITALKR